MFHLFVHKLGIVPLGNHFRGYRKPVFLHGFQISFLALNGVCVMLRSCHEQDSGQMMLFHQMRNDHRNTTFVVTDQGVTIGHIHDFCKKNRGDPIIFPGKFVGINLPQLDSQCSIINDQTIQSADQAVVMYGIKLIVIGIFLFAAQDIFKKVLRPGSQEKTDIYIQL